MAVALDRNLFLPYYSSYLQSLGLVWFPNLTRFYDNNGRCPRQKFVFGILQLLGADGGRLCAVSETSFKGV